MELTNEYLESQAAKHLAAELRLHDGLAVVAMSGDSRQGIEEPLFGVCRVTNCVTIIREDGRKEVLEWDDVADRRWKSAIVLLLDPATVDRALRLAADGVTA